MTGPHLRAYLRERFPIGPYLVLITAMTLATLGAASLATAEPVRVGATLGLSVLVLLCAFFHLRVFDEHKDYAKDLQAHPERVLSRGLITLADLRRLGGLAIALELGAAALLGAHALAWTVAALGFSVLMRYEFGVGAWLGRHLVLYALTHNPVVGLLLAAVLAGASGTITTHPAMLAMLALGTFTSLGFEIGRKLRAAYEERDGQDTYTAALGIPRATLLLGVVQLGSVASALPLLPSSNTDVVAALLLIPATLTAVRFVRAPSTATRKAVEGVSSLLALGLYVLVAIAAITTYGARFS